MRTYSMLIVISVILVISTSNGFAQTEAPEATQIDENAFTVETSKASYKQGDIIVISGSVPAIITDTPVTLQIFREGNLIEIAQLTVAQDGKYTHTLRSEGPLWKTGGSYIVKASYGPSQTIETQFEYFTNEVGSANEDIFEVDAGSSGTFDVAYTIRGGTIKDMIVDSDIFALIIIIETKSDGEITVDLPRNAIDAKNGDGNDDTFLVFIDGAEVRPEETTTTANSRILEIDFEEGDSDIEIIGTFVIPEFGSLTILVLVLSFVSVWAVSVKRKVLFRI